MGGKSGGVSGYWYRVAYHHGIAATPIDAFLEFRCADKTAWSGEITASTIFHIEQRNLFGGEQDQGGISSDVEILFGDADAPPNVYLQTLGQFISTGDSSLLPYLQSIAGSSPPANPTGQVPGWRGVTTFIFRGGYYGANNPYPQKPAYKIRVTLKGWDNDTCWYPEKAEIVFGETYAYDGIWKYQVEAPGSTADYSSPAYDDSGWSFGPGGFGSTAHGPMGVGTYIAAGDVGKAIWLRRAIPSNPGVAFNIDVYHDDGAWLWWNGYPIALTGTDDVYHSTAIIPGTLVTNQNVVALKVMDSVPTGTPSAIYAGLSIDQGAGCIGMNPAHILYDALTSIDRGAEPIASIKDASFRAGADWFYSQGIGLCTELDPDSETVEQFRERIGKVAGCGVSRSPIDGLWYLDIVNGVYDLDTLPILTDDDILDFAENPSILDDAVNSISVEFVDVQRKATVTTPPVQALALVNANGLHHDVHQYHELPTPELATRFAQRDLQAGITPTRAFDLTTTRKPYGWRVNTYFRLQSVKRGIADMVCLLAEKSSGTLKSGAMKLTASQDIYSMPATSFVQVEQGVDSRPPQIPLAVPQQAAFEAPYFEVVRHLSRADLSALPNDVGYLMTAAAVPGAYFDYTISVSIDGGDTYASGANGQWCPNAQVIEGDTLTEGLVTHFTLAGGSLLARVTVGSAALWVGASGADEVCRVDAIDLTVTPPTMTLGRGCADSVPADHAANARIWFFDGFAGADPTEYTDGESINVKLLTNSGSQQLDPSFATPLALTFDQRQYRPYPPGNLTINGSRYPAAINGTDGLTLTWSTRGRLAQADQLIDTTAANTSPEAGQTATVRIYDDADVLIRTEAGLTTNGFVYSLAAESADMGLTGQAPDPYWNNVVSLLHLDGDDGSAVIGDETGRVWIADGTAQLDTARSKFGGAALLLDGTGLGIYSTNVAGTGPGTGDFTYECFVYRTRTVSEEVLLCMRNASLSQWGNVLAIKNGLLSFSNGSSWKSTTSTVPLNQWCHVAISRASSVLRLFIDGVQGFQISDNTGLPTPDRIVVGAYDNSTVGTFAGSIDEVRLTNGLARYTANFAPPAQPFSSQTSVQGLNGRLRVELESVRNAVVSLQHHDVVIRRAGYGFNYGMFYGGKA